MFSLIFTIPHYPMGVIALVNILKHYVRHGVKPLTNLKLYNSTCLAGKLIFSQWLVSDICPLMRISIVGGGECTNKTACSSDMITAWSSMDLSKHILG